MDVNLNRLHSFVAVVDAGSLTRAAQTLGVTKAMLSMHLKQLEDDLGCTLLIRTTRTITLTDVGQRFYDDCVQLLNDAQRAVDNARSGQTRLTGELRVSSTLEYGIEVVVPALAAFADLHPDLSVDFSGTTSLVNLVSERFDVAIRLGQLDDSRYRARSLGQFDIVLVSTPAYVERHGIPRTPKDLKNMRWVVLTGFEQRIKLANTEDSSAPFAVPFRSSIQADSALTKLHFILANLGIGVFPEWIVRQDLKKGTLIRLLPDYRMEKQGVFAVYPNVSHVPAKVRQFIDFLQPYVDREAEK